MEEIRLLFNKFEEKFNYQFRLIKEKRVIIDEAISRNQDLAKDEVKRIKEINEILNSSKPILPYTLLDIAGILLVILAFCILQCQVKTADVELNVVLSKVDFKLSEGKNVFRHITLKSIDVLEFETIELPKSKFRNIENIVANSGIGTDINIFPVSDETVESELTLKPIPTSKNTFISIKVLDKINSYNITLSSENKKIKTIAKNRIELRTSEGVHSERNYTSPKPISFNFESNRKSINIEVLNNSSALFSNSLNIDSLSLLNIEGKSTVSTIISGTLFFKNISNRNINLVPGQILELDVLNGKIDLLQLKKGQIIVLFNGEVRNINGGYRENMKNIMPTMMDQFIDYLGIEGFLATITFIFTVVYKAVVPWLKSTLI